MTTYPGDPLTPGIGAVPGAKRLTREEAATILKIPVLPISYADATKIMAGDGRPDGAGRTGAAPCPSPIMSAATTRRKVRLAVKSDWSLKPAYNVIAKLPGKDRPDEWVVRGNHHDGWVFGASDPLSGDVAMLSEAKALGALAKTGWRPSRTIVYASWDAEEPMLLGSRPNGPRRTPTSCRKRRSSTSTPMAMAAASCLPRAAMNGSTSSTRWRAM